MHMEDNEAINRAYCLYSYFCLISTEKMSSSEDYVKTLLIYWKESLFLSLLLLQTTMVLILYLPAYVAHKIKARFSDLLNTSRKTSSLS